MKNGVKLDDMQWIDSVAYEAVQVAIISKVNKNIIHPLISIIMIGHSIGGVLATRTLARVMRDDVTDSLETGQLPQPQLRSL